MIAILKTMLRNHGTSLVECLLLACVAMIALTGAKAIGEGLDIQLKNIQISDLGQARKIFIDKNNTMLEARSRDDQLSFQT